MAPQRITLLLIKDQTKHKNIKLSFKEYFDIVLGEISAFETKMGKSRNSFCGAISRNYVNINCDTKATYKYRVHVDIRLSIYAIYDTESTITHIVG